MKIAFLFPGQGAQYVGMGEDIFERYEAAKQIYETASMISGIDLQSLSFIGPESRLKETENAQITIFTMSLAIFNILIEAGVKPDIVAGHSSGEYSAIVAAGALDMEDGIRLIKERGRIMSKAGKKYSGSMAAITGLSFEEIDDICRHERGSNYVDIANYNAPGQVVISGTKKGVDTVIQLARKKGARAVYLSVSGAFHSPLMREASLEFMEVLKNIKIKTPTCPVIGNVSASILLTSYEIMNEMKSHMLSPVKWYETIEGLFDMGIRKFIEVGPGKVLKGLVLRINREAEVYTTTNIRELDMTIKRVKRR